MTPQNDVELEKELANAGGMMRKEAKKKKIYKNNFFSHLEYEMTRDLAVKIELIPNQTIWTKHSEDCVNSTFTRSIVAGPIAEFAHWLMYAIYHV